jgi:AmmeMemoRadiSam system protein B
MSEWVRPAAVAGRFYPDDAAALSTAIASYVRAADDARASPANPRPKAVIAPHAGYVYSGPVAGYAFARVAPLAGSVSRVVLAGPAHRAPVRRVATTSASALATPLGLVPVDGEARALALQTGGVSIDDDAHAPEHSLEVELPFLQHVLGRFAVLPLAVGPGGPPVLADVLDALWGGDETLIVVSTDLSHYHDDRTAKRLDRVTAERIVAGDAPALRPDDACGCWAVQGLLLAAARHDLGVELLDLRTSADTAGPPDRVVGYGAFALAPA